MAEEPPAYGPDDEAEREEDGGIQLLNDRVAARKERAGEEQRERGVGVEVVPLDEVANRADEDRFQPPADVGEIEARLVDG